MNIFVLIVSSFCAVASCSDVDIYYSSCSYFGPAYAKATKIQRAIQLSENLLVIENQTQLADIPFADRFLVVERWIVEAVENDSSDRVSSEDMATYTSKLTVYAEVVMLKSCSWEAQIQKKASKTFTDLVTDWCKTATKALKATEEKKRARLGLSRGNDEEKQSLSSIPNRMPQIPPTTKGSELMAQHRRNFQELDNLVAKGDLEWCSVEVMYSSKAGKHSAFAQVLESETVTGLSKSSTEETDITDSTEGSMRAVMMEAKRRNRIFLRLLNVRKNKSDSTARTR